MNAATTVVLMLIRLTGLVLIIVGALFWSGHALTLIPIHKQLGYVFVLALWALAGIGARAGVNPGFVVLVLLWGFFLAVLGMTQDRLLIGDVHWVIKVLHLLVGLGAMGLGEGVAARIKGPRTPALQRQVSRP